MSEFICPKCGYKTKRKDICPQCKAALVKLCPVCGGRIDFCTCTGIIPQSKGPGKKT